MGNLWDTKRDRKAHSDCRVTLTFTSTMFRGHFMKISGQSAKTISPLSVAGLLIVGIWALVSFVTMFLETEFGLGQFFSVYFPMENVLFIPLPDFVSQFLYFWGENNFGLVSLVVLPSSVAVCILGFVTLQARFRIAAAAFGGLQLISVVVSNYGLFGFFDYGYFDSRYFRVLLKIALLPSIGVLLLVLGEIIARQRPTSFGAPLGDMTSTTVTGAQNTTAPLVQETSTVVYCGQCGKQNPATASFCNRCGAALVV